MNRKAIILGIVAVLAVVGLGFLFKGDSFFKTNRETRPAERPITSGAATVYVDYTNSGYAPATVRIKLGDTVVFTNGSTHPMWIASDPHPVHSVYPQFDAKKGYSPGESYSYTFEKAGAWGYHNHSQPTDTGKIVVENQ